MELLFPIGERKEEEVIIFPVPKNEQLALTMRILRVATPFRWEGLSGIPQGKQWKDQTRWLERAVSENPLPKLSHGPFLSIQPLPSPSVGEPC